MYIHVVYIYIYKYTVPLQGKFLNLRLANQADPAISGLLLVLGVGTMESSLLVWLVGLVTVWKTCLWAVVNVY